MVVYARKEPTTDDVVLDHVSKKQRRQEFS